MCTQNHKLGAVSGTDSGLDEGCSEPAEALPMTQTVLRGVGFRV